jgi:hypothetical protein
VCHVRSCDAEHQTRCRKDTVISAQYRRA